MHSPPYRTQPGSSLTEIDADVLYWISLLSAVETCHRPWIDAFILTRSASVTKPASSSLWLLKPGPPQKQYPDSRVIAILVKPEPQTVASHCNRDQQTIATRLLETTQSAVSRGTRCIAANSRLADRGLILRAFGADGWRPRPRLSRRRVTVRDLQPALRARLDHRHQQPAFRRVDQCVHLRTLDRRTARSSHPPRPHPRDERRQLPPQTEQAPSPR
jgi:hypothetical protein